MMKVDKISPIYLKWAKQWRWSNWNK